MHLGTELGKSREFSPSRGQYPALPTARVGIASSILHRPAQPDLLVTTEIFYDLPISTAPTTTTTIS